MLAYILVAATLPAMILGYPIQPCGGGMPNAQAMRIQGCPTSPCNITAGSIVPFEIDFIGNEVSDTLFMEVYMTAFGETTRFPIPDALANACNWLSAGSCPTFPGQFKTQSAAMPIIVDFHGGIPLTAQMILYNASGSVCVCSIIQTLIY